MCVYMYRLVGVGCLKFLSNLVVVATVNYQWQASVGISLSVFASCRSLSATCRFSLIADTAFLCGCFSVDTSYLTPEADDVLIPTAWIPLLDADSRNGCMEVLSSYFLRGFL